MIVVEKKVIKVYEIAWIPVVGLRFTSIADLSLIILGI